MSKRDELAMIIPVKLRADFYEWVRDGGYDESEMNRHDSRFRQLQEQFLEEMKDDQGLE